MVIHSPSPPLTNAEKLEVFKLATRSFLKRNADAIERGMTDDELESALVEQLGIFGGSGGPKEMSVSYQGAGLKIWGGWRPINHVTEEPVFSGKRTIAFAREVYKIHDPSDKQQSLF